LPSRHSAAYVGFAFWLKKRDFASVGVHPLAFGILMRVALLPLPPTGSDDLYRYIWDGKVQSAGINPYRYVPDAPELSDLHTAELPSRVNHPSMKTIYFPFTQWAFWLGFQIAGEDFRGIKLMLLAAELGTLLMLMLLLRWAKVPEKYILLYALCPLPILQFALDGHIDALGLPVLLFALSLWVREKKAASLLLIGVSMSVKPVGLILLPLLFFREQGLPAKLRVLLLPLVPLVLQFLPYSFSANPLESVVIFGVHWEFNGAVFEVINAFVDNNQQSRTMCAVLLAAGVLALAIRRGPLLDSSYKAVLMLLLLSPVVHPWYVSWLAIFLPVARRWSGILFVATVSLSVLTVLEYRLIGMGPHPWVLVGECACPGGRLTNYPAHDNPNVPTRTC
jgi:hypothetical protein